MSLILLTGGAKNIKKKLQINILEFLLLFYDGILTPNVSQFCKAVIFL